MAPATIDEAVALLAEHGDRARCIAGGTDILVQARNGRYDLEAIVDVKKIPELMALEVDARGLNIGAAVPCCRIYEDSISKYHQNGTDIDKHAFKLFVFGEFYLRQKKLSEASASYAFVQEHYPDASIFSDALLRETLVQLKLNQIQKAELLAEQLTKTKSAYKGWALLGEIQEIYNENNEEALKHYFTLLEKYPDCYLAEPIRLHVRKLKDKMKS